SDLGGRIPRAIRQSIRGGGARLCGRRDRTARDAAARDPRAAHAGEQSGHDAAQEARKYPAMKWGVWLLLLAAPAYGQDWDKLGGEMLDKFTTLLRIDSSNPPGNETQVAKVVQAMLEREGIPSRIYSLDPSRGNLVARIKGNGRKRPILIMGHTDVV